MNEEILKPFDIDFSKTILHEDGITFHISFFKKAFLKYYHSQIETINYYGNVIIHNRNTNKILNFYSFPISENDWEFYQTNRKSNIEVLYDKTNNIILIFRENLSKSKKIIEIIYFANLIRENVEEKLLTESRLCDHKFEINTLKIKNSIKGKITLEFDDLDKNLKNTFDIWNISDDDYSDAIDGSPFDDITIDEEKYYRLEENEKAENEINKFGDNFYYLPYKFFSEEEWKNVIKRFPSKYFRTSLDEIFKQIVVKYDSGKQPDETDKNSILKEIELRFNEDKENYIEPEYKTNANDWLKDAAGTSDPEIMNDVYWNLD